MGMAASQARWLELTARKTNVEYAGQQINQQRTALANESAGLFSQLMGLTVPTAPSSSDYTRTQYTFTDGENTYTITGVNTKTGDPNYNASVTYRYDTVTYTGVAKIRSDLGVKNEGTVPNPVYWLTDGAKTNPQNQIKLTQCQVADLNYDIELQELKQICKDNPASQLALDVGYDPVTGNIADITGAYYYKSASSGRNNYYSATDLQVASGSQGVAVNLTGYYATNLDTHKTKTEDAYIEKTETGRYSTIKLASENVTLDLKATTTTDQNAYNDAMNEYEYRQQLYQQQVNAINAKTSIIQQQDKTLELQLHQLDTEQKALTTELEAVKKVIEKNIDQTFKTFAN